jgi:hypothetical protein
MKRLILGSVFSMAFLLAASTGAYAQVKQVEMHIGGYLCGN